MSCAVIAIPLQYCDQYLGILVSFVSQQFTGSEKEGYMLISLKLVNGTSAYPFNVTVIPSEQSPVSAQGDNKICTV